MFANYPRRNELAQQNQLIASSDRRMQGEGFDLPQLRP